MKSYFRSVFPLRSYLRFGSGLTGFCWVRAASTSEIFWQVGRRYTVPYHKKSVMNFRKKIQAPCRSCFSFLSQCGSGSREPANQCGSGFGSWPNIDASKSFLNFYMKNILKVGNRSKNMPCSKVQKLFWKSGTRFICQFWSIFMLLESAFPIRIGIQST